MFSKFALGLALFTSANVFAQAISFKTLKSARENGMFRMTCSDTSKKMQAHLYLTIEKDKVVELTMYAITPAESVWSTSYSASDLKGLKLTDSDAQIAIEGDRPGVYFPETLAFNVKEDAKGAGKFKARLDWDSMDGEELHRDLTCGAVNYVNAPAN